MTTIYALASGAGRAGVAVIRISGAAALTILQSLCGKTLPPRVMTHVTLAHAGKRLDRALAVCFKAPASFTGEDVVELHLHGGRAVVEGVSQALSALSARPAEPGEFTRRAFENGKLDLTEAEAIADLVDAETEAQRHQALGQMAGALSRLYGDWSQRLTTLLAHQEADIEFPDEDLPAGLADTLAAPIAQLLGEIAAHLDDGRRGEILRDGLRVAIIGAPNAGKSSLLNALAARDVAIVSAEAGTTRDVIEVRLDLGGYPVIVADTAGLRATDNTVEKEGIRRARGVASDADIKIALFEGGNVDAATKEMVDEKTILVHSKCDLYPPHGADAGMIALSTATGAGMAVLLEEMARRAARLFDAGHGRPSLTRQRHRDALAEARDALARAQSAALPELAAEDLRLALRALGRITGRVHVEEVLDRVFRDFCIGK